MAKEVVRRPMLMRRAMEILADDGGWMRPMDVIERVRETFPLNEHELSRNASGYERFDTAIRYASDALKGAGWIRKKNRTWQITEAGRKALAEFSESADLYREVVREYTEARSQADHLPTEGDKWRLLDVIAESTPEGRWILVQDLADLAHLEHREVEDYMRRNHPEVVPEGRLFMEMDAPAEAQIPRPELESRAELLRVTDHTQRAWLIRGSSVRGMNLVPQWLEDGFCSLPAARLNSARPGMSLGQLKELVDQNYDYLSYSARRDLAAEAHQFLNRMRPGDIVMTNNEDAIHLGVIASGPEVRDDTDGISNLRRDVEWRTLDEPLDLVDLPSQVEAKLSTQGSVVDLTAELEELRTILPVAPFVAKEITEEPAREGVAEREAVLKDATPQLAKRLFVDQEWLQEVIELLRYRRQIIFYGPPGTGKTFLAQEIAWHLAERDRVKLVQFHPAYSYEDFFEGFRPVSTEEGKFVGFELAGGPLRKLTDAAVQAQEQPHVMIIDELNRANPAKVFGELYFLLEYRDRSITPLYRPENEEFLLPRNVFFIATMNTSDRSIASLDAAIRRRFAFVELHPAEPPVKDLLRKWLADRKLDSEPAELLDELNRSIAERDQQLGPSSFMDKNVYVDGGLARMWRTSILPLLEEHYLDSGTDVRAKFSLDAVRRAIARRGSGSSAAP